MDCGAGNLAIQSGTEGPTSTTSSSDISGIEERGQFAIYYVDANLPSPGSSDTLTARVTCVPWPYVQGTSLLRRGGLGAAAGADGGGGGAARTPAWREERPTQAEGEALRRQALRQKERERAAVEAVEKALRRSEPLATPRAQSWWSGGAGGLLGGARNSNSNSDDKGR
jgi:hypothetical protein